MTKPNCFVTNHVVNQNMSSILAQGFEAQQVPASTGLLPGLAIVYGILRGTAEILKQAEAEQQPYLYVDHSYFSQCRSDHDNKGYNGYYRIVKNGRYTHPSPDYPSDRFEALGITLQPWRSGRHVVVAPLSNFVADFYGINPLHWLRQTVRILKSKTDRDIVIKPKDSDQSLEETLKGAHCLVTLDSNAAVDAAVMGIPVFCSKVNAAAPVANIENLDIEAPLKPERSQWAANLSYMQWTIPEIKAGLPKRVYNL